MFLKNNFYRSALPLSPLQPHPIPSPKGEGSYERSEGNTATKTPKGCKEYRQAVKCGAQRSTKPLLEMQHGKKCRRPDRISVTPSGFDLLLIQ